MRPAGARPRPSTRAGANTGLSCFSSLVISQQNSSGSLADVATASVLVAQRVNIPLFSWVGLLLLVSVFLASAVNALVQAAAPNNKTGMITEALVLTRSRWRSKKSPQDTSQFAEFSIRLWKWSTLHIPVSPFQKL